MIKPEQFQYLLREPAGRLVVGYSGGMDSHVLLHLLVKLKQEESATVEILALHINHGLSDQSNRWQDHCANVCNELKVPFAALRVSVELAGKGTEASARKARYQAFQETLRSGDLLLLAHHADDQAETILFRLMRGGGLNGLAGMPARRRLGEAVLLRPLLHLSRESLVEYAGHQGLRWVEDESNRDTRFDRNFIRHNIVPVFKQRWPSYAQTWIRSAGLAAVGFDLNRELADLDLRELCGSSANRIDLTKLKTLSQPRQQNLLYRWVERAGLPLPSHAQLQQVVTQFAGAGHDANPLLKWRGAEVRRFRNHAYLMRPLAPHDSCAELHLNAEHDLAIDIGALTASPLQGGGIWLEDGPSSVTVRFRQGGERCQPAGRLGSHPLKKIFQELQVPPWLRDRIPLIYVGKKIAAVAGLFNCQDFTAGDGQTGWEFSWSFTDADLSDHGAPLSPQKN